MLDHQAGVQEAAEIGAGGWGGYVGLFSVATAVGATDQALLEGDDQTVRPLALLDQGFEALPARGRLLDLDKALPCLCDVSLEAEPDPAGGVAVRVVAAALGLAQAA